MKQSSEVFWWSLFSAGGVMSALFLPALIVATGLILPFSAGDDPAARYEQVHKIVAFWPVRLVLFGVIGLSCFHAAHRVRHILMDLGLRHLHGMLIVVCYGGAAVGAVAAAVILVKL